MQFLAVTLFGLWVLQTVVIYGLSNVVDALPGGVFSWLGPLSALAMTLTPKLLATGVSLVWNYFWYSRVIFTQSDR